MAIPGLASQRVKKAGGEDLVDGEIPTVLFLGNPAFGDEGGDGAAEGAVGPAEAGLEGAAGFEVDNTGAHLFVAYGVGGFVEAPGFGEEVEVEEAFAVVEEGPEVAGLDGDLREGEEAPGGGRFAGAAGDELEGRAWRIVVGHREHFLKGRRAQPPLPRTALDRHCIPAVAGTM